MSQVDSSNTERYIPPIIQQTLKEPCPFKPMAGHWHFKVLCVRGGDGQWVLSLT